MPNPTKAKIYETYLKAIGVKNSDELYYRIWSQGEKNTAIVSATPRTHIECTSGGFFFLLMQRILAHILAPRALPPTEAGWRLRQLPTGHDAMITMPRELADLLLEVV